VETARLVVFRTMSQVIKVLTYSQLLLLANPASGCKVSGTASIRDLKLQLVLVCPEDRGPRRIMSCMMVATLDHFEL